MKNKTSIFYLLNKGLKLSLINIWRNKFLSLVTIFIIGIIIFVFNVILAINFIAEDSINNLSKKIDLVVYLKESSTINEAQMIKEDLLELEGVENVTYTSKEDALKQIKITHPNILLAFEKYNLKNPLPASLNISTNNPKEHSKIIEFLNQSKYQTFLSNTTSNNTEQNAIMSSVSQNLIKLSNFTYQVIFWLIITFIIGGALITLNSLQVTIFTRRKEIEVMKLVGASYWFIRLPFIIEAIIYGLTAILTSFLLLFLLSKNTDFQNLNIYNRPNSEFYLILLSEIGITILLTTLSSIIAIHEHLFKNPSK